MIINILYFINILNHRAAQLGLLDWATWVVTWLGTCLPKTSRWSSLMWCKTTWRVLKSQVSWTLVWLSHLCVVFLKTKMFVSVLVNTVHYQVWVDANVMLYWSDPDQNRVNVPITQSDKVIESKHITLWWIFWRKQLR